MFEGSVPLPGESRAHEPQAGEAERLLALSWTDLVARLRAARDLRCAIDDSRRASDASFDADSARRIAAQHGKPLVNRNASGNGKGLHGTALTIQLGAGEGELSPRREE